MTKQEFIDLFVEELEIENTDITLETVLDSIDEWDSMAAMMVIALAKNNFDVSLNNNDLKQLTDINSLIEKIGINKFQ